MKPEKAAKKKIKKLQKNGDPVAVSILGLKNLLNCDVEIDATASWFSEGLKDAFYEAGAKTVSTQDDVLAKNAAPVCALNAEPGDSLTEVEEMELEEQLPVTQPNLAEEKVTEINGEPILDAVLLEDATEQEAEAEQSAEEAVEEQSTAAAEENETQATEPPVSNAPAKDVLLELRNLKKYFVVGTNFVGKANKFLHAVDNVSLSLKKGKTLGIVGESGCGKTTMGRTILRLHEPTSGEVWFNGQEVTKLSNKEFDKLRPNMQMIFQDPYASLSPRLTVGAIIGEAALQHGLVTKENYREYVLEIMKMCGLQPHYYERYPHEFSGGQRQRICIARALALKPQLVVCDEPVSALDVSIQAQIINMLKELQQELGLTYVFISHDLSVVKHISDEVGVMYLGSMVEYGSKERIFENTLHPYTKALFSAVPVPNPHVKMNRVILKGDIPSPVNPPKGCKFHTRCDKCMEICKHVTPTYREVEEGHFCACHLYATEEELSAFGENSTEKKED